MATIEELLKQLDLGKYIEKFKAEDIDLAVASKLSDDDLKDLGLTIGARKKLHEALRSQGAAVTAAPPAAVAKAPATVPAAASVSPSSGGDSGDIYSWDWCFNGTGWPEQSGSSKHERIRLAEGDDPKIVIVTSRGNDDHQSVPVMDIKAGHVLHRFQASAKDLRTTVMDADLFTNIVCAVGSDYHDSAVAVFYDLNSYSEVGCFRGNNEGGLYGVTLLASASGAMQAVAANMKDCSKMITHDVGTARRSGKPLVVPDITVHDSAREMKRDPNNPGCFCVGYDNGKIFYIDARAGKVVRKIMAGNRCDSLRLPASTPNRGVLSDGDSGVRVFDIGSGRTIHQIKEKSWGVAMYGNTVVTSKDNKVHFWDIGQPEVIASHSHDLTYDYSMVDLDMSRNVVVGINCGILCSMKR